MFTKIKTAQLTKILTENKDTVWDSNDFALTVGNDIAWVYRHKRQLIEFGFLFLDHRCKELPLLL